MYYWFIQITDFNHRVSVMVIKGSTCLSSVDELVVVVARVEETLVNEITWRLP